MKPAIMFFVGVACAFLARWITDRLWCGIIGLIAGAVFVDVAFDTKYKNYE
jgi:nicotinamide riboside transporter PnuC